MEKGRKPNQEVARIDEVQGEGKRVVQETNEVEKNEQTENDEIALRDAKTGWQIFARCVCVNWAFKESCQLKTISRREMMTEKDWRSARTWE